MSVRPSSQSKPNKNVRNQHLAAVWEIKHARRISPTPVAVEPNTWIAGDVDFVVTDFTGGEVSFDATTCQPAGRHRLRLPVGGLSSGLYMVSLRAGSEAYSQMLVVLSK
jgi:hypothetical protein